MPTMPTPSRETEKMNMEYICHCNLTFEVRRSKNFCPNSLLKELTPDKINVIDEDSMAKHERHSMP